jgi:menaquinone-specific isochorismate synthase
MTPHALARLAARTEPFVGPSDLAAAFAADGFLWDDGETTFVTRGVAARVAADDVVEVLAAIPGTGTRTDLPLRAVGALPFDPTAPAELVIPAEVLTRFPDGTWWRTVIADPTATDADDVRVDPGRFTVARGSDPAHWNAMVQAALAAIEADELTKVVLAREVEVTAEAPFDAVSILRRLGAQNPGCMIFADATAGGVFLGASPELLVERRGTAVTSRPMAGTIAAGADDATLRTLKNEHEHQVVIDAVLEALRAADVRIDATTPSIASLSTVAHLATEVRGTTTAATTALDLARALSPTPAVAGTPREHALAFIAEHEAFARGRYGGPVGWVDANGDGSFAVALRCGLVDGATARLYAGAGIVAGSDPVSEWAETQAKLEPMLRALVRP